MKMNSAMSRSRSSITAKYTRFGASGREGALIRDVRHSCRGDGAGGGFSAPNRVSAEDFSTFAYERTNHGVEKLREDGGVLPVF